MFGSFLGLVRSTILPLKLDSDSSTTKNEKKMWQIYDPTAKGGNDM